MPNINEVPAKTRLGEITRLPTASNYQIKIFEAIESSARLLIDGKAPKSIMVNATAGSGKTTTLIAATRLIPAELSTIFVAFSKKIAEELAARLPMGIPAKTFHAFWLRQWGQHCYNMHRASAKINDYKVKNAVEKHLGISRFQRKKMSPEQNDKAKKLRETADDVCFLVEKAKLFGVVPQGYPGANSVAGFEDNDFFWDYVMNYFNHPIEPEELNDTIKVAREILWAGLDNELEIDFHDMMYLPAVKGLIGERYQIVMVDEGQDLNQLQRFLLTRMIEPGGMLICIGDNRQCQPAGTMISIPGEYTGSRTVPIITGLKPIEDLCVGDQVVSYATKKSNFTGITKQSGVRVEDTGSRMYEGFMYNVSVGDKLTRATNNHRWLVRFNESARNKYALYLMRKGNTWRVGVSRLLYQLGFGPSCRARAEKADNVYILRVFDTKKEALIEEKYVTSKWQIPDVVFEYNDQRPTLKMSKDEYSNFISEFWDKWNTDDSHHCLTEGRNCLEYYGQDYDYPIWVPNGNGNHLGRYTFVIPSVNLLSDVMSMKTFDGTIHGGEWLPIQVTKTYVKEQVYSLKVTSLHDNEFRRLYVADGIVTHNSIFAFRGADSESMNNLKTEFDCVELPLSISYRCAKSIVKLAYQIYPEIEARPNAPEGSVEYPTSFNIENFQPGHLIICRQNAPTVTLAYKLIKHRIPAKVLGRDIGDGLIKLIRKLDSNGSLIELMENVVAWREHQLDLADRKDPDDIRAKEAIMDKYECISTLSSDPDIRHTNDLIDVIDTMFTTAAEEKTAVSDSRVTLSTIHKIKGAEADTVFLLDAHLINPPWIKSEWQYIQEMNLKFVAYSRAKTRLVFISSTAIH